jgi:hypothetical protein
MALYLYAIIKEQDRSFLDNLGLEGMNGQAVHCHSLSPYAIIYSETAEDRYLASRANLLTHERVIEQVMHRLPVRQAVPLPLQFGLVVEDWDKVHNELITPYGDSLLKLLEELIGKREVGVKIFWQAVDELNWLVQHDEYLKAQRSSLSGKILSMDEAIAIGQALESALEERQKLIVHTFLGELMPLCHRYVEGELLTENMVYNGAFLIDDDREPEFAETVEKLDQHFQKRYRIRYNNFTAPYNFVSLD